MASATVERSIIGANALLALENNGQELRTEVRSENNNHENLDSSRNAGITEENVVDITNVPAVPITNDSTRRQKIVTRRNIRIIKNNKRNFAADQLNLVNDSFSSITNALSKMTGLFSNVTKNSLNMRTLCEVRDNMTHE